MVQDNLSCNKIKENKYKILRMSLLLGNGEDKEETINNFEDASREIDTMNDEIYLKDLEVKFYDTLTLEEEEKKLTELVDLIGGRIEQRLSLLSDFSNVTGYELMNLPPIKYYDKLDEYKERLNYIREYLENSENIEKLNAEISDIENHLNDAYVSKATSEKQNEKEEADLLKKFNVIISKIPELKDINIDNVDSKLNDIISIVEDSKKSLEIFDKSFATLNQAGISGEEKEEYLSYVNSAREIYYNDKEQEFLLRLYILFNTEESDYNRIIAKRDTINNIINDRIELRKELQINKIDPLNDIYDILENQYKNIKKQKNNIDNIEILTIEINDKREQVKKLEIENQKVEILSLLKEFCIIDTFDEPNIDTTPDLPIEDIEINESDSNIESLPPIEFNIETNIEPELEQETETETESEPVQESEPEQVEEEIILTTDTEDIKENQVVSISPAKDIDIEASTQKSNNVMKRVGEMLGVKVDKPKIVSVEEEPEQKEEVKEPEPEIIEENTQLDTTQPEVENNNKSDGGALEELIGNSTNIFTDTTFDADPETVIENNPLENPMFTGGEFNPEPKMENPLFNNEIGNSTIDDIMAKNDFEFNTNNDEFWYSQEETPLDLNSLPDLTTTNDNFFNTTNNGMPELVFPNLDMAFDEEGNQ